MWNGEYPFKRDLRVLAYPGIDNSLVEKFTVHKMRRSFGVMPHGDSGTSLSTGRSPDRDRRSSRSSPLRGSITIDYEDRECFYAEHALPPFPHLLIKVVVQFDDAANGRVITVYPLKRQKTSEARIWPTS